MGALAIAIPYVLFVWWFSTGTVLLLVGLSVRHAKLLKAAAALLFAASFSGLVVSSHQADAAGAYCVFTCAILVWGAIEISLLAGWITGPRPEPCAAACTTIERLWLALQATAYHELTLVVAAAMVFAFTSGAPNQLGWWTFAALLALRQSAKLNLFLGVRTLNDELLPMQVRFLRSYFRRRPINALFPLSVTLATAAAAFLALAAIDAASQFHAVAFSLLAVLVLLGALEHWFMVLPFSVVDLWRWSIRVPTDGNAASRPMEPPARPTLAVIPGGASMPERPVAQCNAARLARQRLEDQFREAYRERQSATEVKPIAVELVGAAQQTMSIGINRAIDGRAP